MRLRSRQRRCWSSLDDLCGRLFANTARYLACMVVAVRLNSPIAHYKIPAVDFVTKPPSEENLGRGEGMEAGAGFPVHHGFGSLRYSALLSSIREAVRAVARLACFDVHRFHGRCPRLLTAAPPPSLGCIRSKASRDCPARFCRLWKPA